MPQRGRYRLSVKPGELWGQTILKPSTSRHRCLQAGPGRGTGGGHDGAGGVGWGIHSEPGNPIPGQRATLGVPGGESCGWPPHPHAPRAGVGHPQDEFGCACRFGLGTSGASPVLPSATGLSGCNRTMQI